jgi:NAD(P)H-nitrite reductase large subunit
MAAEALDHVVVVGAGVAGLTAAGALRRRGHRGTITVVGAEGSAPYDRPPLSKQVLTGDWGTERIRLRPAPELEAADATWLLAESATGLDLEQRVLHTDRGRALPWEGLVVATGVRPHSLPGRSLPNVHTFRTVGDALALRDTVRDARAAVVVGAGVLGCEIASSLRSLGLGVTVVDVAPTPMLRQLGPTLGAALADRHEGHGVRLHLGVGVRSVEGRGRAERVVLTDGTELEADVVVVAVGGTPDVDWLRDSGLPLDDGIRCDSRLVAAPGVVAAGDVASWANPLFGRMRIEHRSNAGEQGAVAAANLLGADQEYAPVPYFWSEQLGLRIQAHGDPSRTARTEVVSGDPASGRYAAELYDEDGALVAGIASNLPKEGPALRARVLQARTAARGAAA